MIRVISKAFNEKAFSGTNIPDVSHPLILHKVEPGKVDYEFQTDLREYRLDLEFHDLYIASDFQLTPHCQFQLGKFLNFETYLEIDGKEYRYGDIYSHETEMAVIISDAVARQLIEEITDD